MTVNGLSNETVDLQEHSTVIVCTKRTGHFLSRLDPWQLRHIPFEDYEYRKALGSFTRAHARLIIRFIQGLPDMVTNL